MEREKRRNQTRNREVNREMKEGGTEREEREYGKIVRRE